jgi:endonuclease/exonuclease/phosphatase family metal-dependent hydrolase
VLVAQAFEDVEQSRPRERMKAIAREIALARPHLIGLQEVALLRTQFPGDSAGPNPTPATEVAYDFLELLLEALEDKGLHYEAVATVQNVDIEVPSATGEDVRLTDRDVLLARRDVEIDDVEAHNFAARLVVPLGGPGGPVVTILRGWVEADATIDDLTYRVANTHLEPAPQPAIIPVQLAQATELITALADEQGPVIALGDFNSAADGSTTPTYATLLAAGYLDAWSQARRHDPGYTCCQAADLRNPVSQLSERIDLILVKQPYAPHARKILADVDAVVLGDERWSRTRSGLWPSDHAGVAAGFKLPDWAELAEWHDDRHRISGARSASP